MKKLLLTAFFSVAALAGLLAQPCTPDPNFNQAGISPSKLPNGIVGTPYNETVTLKVPLDTTLLYDGNLINVRVDSASVIYISDLPATFSYECDKESRTWNGGTKGCAKLTGTPVEANIGSYVVWVKTHTWFKIIGLSSQFDQIDSSSINFKIEMPSGVQELKQVLGMRVYPNPVTTELVVETNNFRPGISYKIIDLLGREYDLESNSNSNTGKVTFNASSLKPGVYLVQATEGDKNYLVKFIKN